MRLVNPFPFVVRGYASNGRAKMDKEREKLLDMIDEHEKSLEALDVIHETT